MKTMMCITSSAIGILVFLLLALLQRFTAKATNTASSDIVMERSLLGSGFHREIKTDLTIPASIRVQHASPHCGLLLFETLPAGIYADPFQIQSLLPFGGPKVLFDRDVNIEAAEFLSRPHELFIFLSVVEMESVGEQETFKFSVSLPIHARYHKPSTDPNISHAVVRILHPGLFSNCSTISGSPDTLAAPCDMSNSSMCKWLHLPCMSKSPLIKFHVPAGQEKDKPMVVIGTLVFSVATCAILIKLIWTTADDSHDKAL